MLIAPRNNQQCYAVIVYTDRGVSSGMQAGIERAAAAVLPVEYRSIRS